LAYALAGRVDAIDWRAAEFLEKALEVEVFAGARATSLRTDTRTLGLGDGREISYDALVIATGARGQRLGVPGADLPGVFTLRDIEDLRGIERIARPGRPAVVVGGGNVGLQAAEALSERGLSVTVVLRSPHLLSQMVDGEAGRRVGVLFSEHRLGLRPGRDPVEILGNERVTAVKLDDGELLEADLVVVGKGIVPNVEWLEGSGVEVGRGVRVDRSGRTNVPGVFAAGDCAETTDPLTGTSTVSGIWPVAYEMGRAAGSAAVGLHRPSAGALRLNASKFFGRTIISIGEVREDRLPDARALVLESSSDVYKKLVYRDDRLVGALLYGDIAQAGEYYRLYREAVTRPLERE
jgi:NAD(P)H-nitrite reductase large subunit